jgi:hypothetical protein
MEITSKYATRIPVVALPGTESELGWPFTYEELKTFLAA